MSRDSTLKACLVGAGHIGRFHTRHLSQHENWACVGIFDPDSERASLVGKEFSVKVSNSFEALLEASDAVFITCPTAYHFQYADMALKAGKHVFIEKPITQTISEAEHLVSLAKSQQLKIQVGHVERFNPALLALNDIDLNPKFIEAHRLVRFVPRGMDNPVVHENMIHDIDIILSLVKSPVKSIQANGVTVVSERPDIANARITFENGCVANVTASRISLNPMRKMRLFQPEHYITIDFQKGSTELYRLRDKGDTHDMGQTIPMEGSDKVLVYSNKQIPEMDAMYAEQAAFAKAIINDSVPVVSGQDGLEALRIAELINQQLLDQQ